MHRANDVYSQCGINTPASHQERAWDALSQGRPIILRAPTGSGKTEAVALPFLALGGQQLSPRLIYALPLRSLANQIVERVHNYAQRLSKPSNFQVRLQHGEQPESVLFAADVVVATIDQVITSCACTPLTLPVRHGNIPAGAVMSSFLVFDEMHLFDPELGLQATRLICERLHRLGIPYAILSATLPDSVIELWVDRLGAEVIETYSEFVQRQVTVEWRASQLNADAVKQAFGQAHRILVVCNTVDRAVALYQKVAGEAQTQGYACNLLHSRFLPEHRKQKEEWVVQHFGKNAFPKVKALLIATQVVEVGLDLSADLLLTELAPVDALIQRAGRVARCGGEGKVSIYDVKKSAPYSQEPTTKTREILERNSGTTLDWATAECWVNQVLNDFYRTILHESNAYEQVVAQLSRAAFEGSRSRAEAAVREINTVEVTVHSDPQRLGQEVLRLPTINVHIGVAKQSAMAVAQAKAQVWRVEVDRHPSDAQISVELQAVRDVDKDIFIGDRLVFPPSVLSYSSEYGLQAGTSGQDFQPQTGQSRPALPSALPREGWIQHGLDVVRAVEQVLQNEQHAVLGLASLLDVSEDEIKKAAKLAALLHDLGKLNRDWQNKAGVSDSADLNDLLAHTDGRDYVPFPPHATVGAYALWPALVDGGALPRLLAKTVCFAIAHHHSVRAKEVPQYEFHPAWQGAIQEALRSCGLDGALDPRLIVASQPSPTNLREQFPPMEYERLYTAYVLLSRWLRLADRIATGGPDALLHYEDWFGRL